MKKILLTKHDFDAQGYYCGELDLSQVLEASIEIEGDLGCCRFRRSLHVRGSIHTRAGSGISAGEGISAKGDLTVGYRIFVGIARWLKVAIGAQREVRCRRLVSGEVCYGDLIETGRDEAIAPENAEAKTESP